MSSLSTDKTTSEKSDNKNDSGEALLDEDIFFMKKAIEVAKSQTVHGEVPVGAIIVKDGEVIASGTNHRETQKNCLCHAEIEAIGNACKSLGGWRLWQCTMYVTLEPCPMCAGAIINARLPRVVFGAYDKKNGSCGSVANLFLLSYNHKPEFRGGILQEECADLLKDFFKRLRKGEIKQFGTHHEEKTAD